MKSFLKPVTGDERRSGAVLEAFDGSGMVRVIEHMPDTVLLERLDPATPLSTIVARDDAEATAVLARVIAVLSPRHVPHGTPSVTDWACSFDQYLARGGREIPHPLVRRAQEVYLQLCASQRNVRLLHGDLHHDNVLFDQNRGWIAVDPKGVVGELEYEVGAALRNPIGLPGVFTDPAVIDRRVRVLSEALSLDRQRVTAWAFSQAVLAAIWLDEDREPFTAEHPWIVLAQTLRERLRTHPYNSDVDPSLPGADLVRKGLDDLSRGVESIESLLVSIGAPRLRGLGISIEGAHAEPEHRLYTLLAREDSDSAHSRYNALIRRLVSFERALECVNPRT